MSVLFCVSFLAFYLQTAPFIVVSLHRQNKRKIASCAHEKKFVRTPAKILMVRGYRLEVIEMPSGGQEFRTKTKTL